MIRRDRDREHHTDPAARPQPERCGLTESELARWDAIIVDLRGLRAEQRRIARRRRWRRVGRTAIALGWLVVLGAIVAYIAVTLVIGA